MQERQQKIVHGYTKRNYKEDVPTEIIDVIYKFYLLYFDSKIMNDEQQFLLVNLIWNRLKSGDKFNLIKNIQSIDFDLLYRGSEHGYLSRKFHEECDKKGATVTIIHNEHDFIFGGYTSKSWPSTTYMTRSNDPHAYLFTIHPGVKVFELANEYKDGKDAITSHINYGPVFGIGTDLYLPNKGGGSCARPKTYAVKRQEFMGAKNETTYTISFDVKEYEVFSIIQQ